MSLPPSIRAAFSFLLNTRLFNVANQTTQTQEKSEKFFAALATGKTVGAACKASGYARGSVYHWKANNEDFARRWQEADDHAVELMEAEADRRALKGTLKPVFYKGAKVGSIREFSDTLLIFRLKGKRPGVYRETPPPGGEQQQISTDYLKRREEALRGVGEIAFSSDEEPPIAGDDEE